jgi:spoIIIJ-associated protein
MEKHNYQGKTREEAINAAKIDLQETEENLIITEKEIKSGLFKTKKIEIEVIEKREVVKFIKSYLYSLLKDMGYTINIEVKTKDNIPTYTIYSNNDSLVIGKNGKNLQALQLILSQVIKKEIGTNFKFLLDVNEYKAKREKSLESLARKTAKEVKDTKIEVKLDSMNSYERRIVHNALVNNKYVYTESIGEEPNREVVIKPKED